MLTGHSSFHMPSMQDVYNKQTTLKVLLYYQNAQIAYNGVIYKHIKAQSMEETYVSKYAFILFCDHVAHIKWSNMSSSLFLENIYSH